MPNYPIIDSVGIEVEMENVRPRRFADARNLSSDTVQFRLTHDASCETNKDTLNGIPITTDDDLARLINMNQRRETFGGEIVSSVIDTSNPNYLKDLKRLTRILNNFGEEPESFRAGFHVHINCPLQLKILKSIVRLSRHLEQVFFLLGTMGYEFRGKKNDSIYCRPITKKGPVIVQSPKGYVPVFSLTNLLETTTIADFKSLYGDLPNVMGMTRYVPVRYHWINLVPLWTQGSLEFRVFNKTLNPLYMKSCIEFCKKFVEYIISTSFSNLKEEGFLRENSVFDSDQKGRQYIIETFLYFSERTKLDTESITSIVDILENGNMDSINLPDEYVHSHLNGRNPVHWAGRSSYIPEIITDRIKNPEFVDVHVLDNRERNVPRRTNNNRTIGTNTTRRNGLDLNEELMQRLQEDRERERVREGRNVLQQNMIDTMGNLATTLNEANDFWAGPQIVEEEDIEEADDEENDE